MDEKTKQEFESKLKTQENLLNKFLKVLGLNSSGDRVAMDMTTADGQTLKITRESGDPQVGDEATPDGSHVMPDGTTIVVTDGKITEIKPAEDMEALKKENADLKAEIESLKQSNSAMQNSIAEAKEAGEKAKALYNELMEIQSKYVPAQRSENFQEPKTTAMSKLNERLENAKKRK